MYIVYFILKWMHILCREFVHTFCVMNNSAGKMSVIT